MQVEGKQYGLLNQALVDSFVVDEIERMLQFGMKQRLDKIVSPEKNIETVVFEIIGYYNRKDLVENLVRAARYFNPSNGQLYTVSQSIGKATQVSERHGEGSLTRVEADGLEILVEERLPLMSATKLRENMMRVEGQMCVVELKRSGGRGEAQGSGFLVGPKAVLTNYHVAREVLEGDNIQRLQVRFDAEPQTGIVRKADEGTVFDVKEIPVSSPYTEGDGRNLKGPPAEDELDFAILLLDGDAGASMVGGGGDQKDPVPRSYIEMPFDAPTFEEGGSLIIYQYPGGHELMVAIDTRAIVNAVHDNKRLRYRNNTKPGSSGSPVFDMGWNLVALHHAGYPTERDLEKLKQEGKPVPDGFNQGIPINLINDYVESKDLGKLFG